jgi:hypothetical protein
MRTKWNINTDLALKNRRQACHNGQIKFQGFRIKKCISESLKSYDNEQKIS